MGFLKLRFSKRIFEHRNINNVVVKRFSPESDFLIVLRIPPGLKTPDDGCWISAAVIGLRAEPEREIVSSAVRGLPP